MLETYDLEDISSGDDAYAGYQCDPDDVPSFYADGDDYDLDWYMDMPDSIRSEFESADRFTIE